MSSMRNAVQRRVHKERGQLHERRHLGLLEKHKDYSLRAADYHKKKQTLRSLRAKAAARNEDEFYHGMLSRRGPGSTLTAGGMPSDAKPSSAARKSWTGTVGTRSGDRGDGVRQLSVDAVRLLKTQDIGYVRTMRRMAERELERVEENARMVGVGVDEERRRGGVAKRIVFCEDGEEREGLLGGVGGGQGRDGKGVKKARRRGAHDEDDDDDEFQGLDDEEEEDEDEDMPDAEEQEALKKERTLAKAREKLRKRLDHARHKVRVLAETEQALDEQRAKMAKTATSGGVTKSGKRIVVRKRKR